MKQISWKTFTYSDITKKDLNVIDHRTAFKNIEEKWNLLLFSGMIFLKKVTIHDLAVGYVDFCI